MSEYIEREAAEEVFRNARKSLNAKKYDYMANEYLTRDTMLLNAEQIIHVLPAADVRPVVFCKDCRHRDPEDHKCDCGQIERAGCIFPVDDDYFCAYGERPNCGADMREGN